MAVKVSVLMSVYNHRDYVAEAINSVLNQTFVDFELIIVNNGSTDGVEEVLSSFSDSRIKVISLTENIRGCLRIAFEESTGDYISILYSDDYYLPSKLFTQAKLLDSMPGISLVYGSVLRLQRSGDFLPSYSLQPKHNTLSPKQAYQAFVECGCFVPPIGHMTRRQAYIPALKSTWFGSDGDCYYVALSNNLFRHDDYVAIMRDHGRNLAKSRLECFRITDEYFAKLFLDEFFIENNHFVKNLTYRYLRLYALDLFRIRKFQEVFKILERLRNYEVDWKLRVVLSVNPFLLFMVNLFKRIKI